MCRVSILSLVLIATTFGCTESPDGAVQSGDVGDPTPDTGQPADTATSDATPPQDSTAAPDAPAPSDTTGPLDTGSPQDAGPPQVGCMAEHFLDLTTAAGAGPSYEAAWVTATCTGDVMLVQSNGMPHYTFVPVTPNALVPVAFEAELPRYPAVAAQTSDIALLGNVGVAVNGAAFYGPNEGDFPDPFGDPQLNAITDACWGHTAQAYHYHALKDECLGPGSLVAEPWTLPSPDPAEPSPVLGFALDGFPVYGPNGCLDEACTQVGAMKSSWEATGYEKVGCSTDADCSDGFQCGKAIVAGEEVNICGSETYAWDNNACTKDTCDEASGQWLDRCNGRFGPDGSYRYHATDTFPYILGCFRGTPVNSAPGPGPGPGPADCDTDADCVDACAAGSQECGCVVLQGGPAAGQSKCVPLCETAADCPAEQPVCVPAGHCGPGMGGGGAP